ncbi:unnamed protein product [Ectocarpus sp. 13 AM-2016]
MIELGVDVNGADWSGFTPLHWTSDKITVDLLIDAGANIEAQEGEGAAAGGVGGERQRRVGSWGGVGAGRGVGKGVERIFRMIVGYL